MPPSHSPPRRETPRAGEHGFRYRAVGHGRSAWESKSAVARSSRSKVKEEVDVVSRVNFLQTTPERLADVAEVVREVVHPGIRGEAGYVGYIVLGSRETGRALGVTLWETDDARARSDMKARQIRPRVEQQTGGTMEAVEPYEVLFYDLRPSG